MNIIIIIFNHYNGLLCFILLFVGFVVLLILWWVLVWRATTELALSHRHARVLPAHVRGVLPPPEGKMIATSDKCSYRCCGGGMTSCTWFHASLPELVCNRLLLKFVGKRTRTESARNTVCPTRRKALQLFYRGGSFLACL